MAAVAGLTATWQGGDEWLLVWTAGSGGSWDVFVDGVQVLTVLEPTARVHMDDGATVDVVETGDEPNEAYPRRITLAWWGIEDAAEYQIEEYVSAVWTWRQTLQDAGQGAFSWVSRVLEDETEHQFRIIALDAAGNESDPETLVFSMVRIPDPPAVTVAVTNPVPGTAHIVITAT
jgi:hypothetical protein